MEGAQRWSPGVGWKGRSGGWLFLLVAVGCGLVAAFLAVRAVEAARHEVPAVVARRVVPPLTRVTADDVALARVPDAALPVQAIRTAQAVVGHFTRMGLVPGEIVSAAAMNGAPTGTSALDVRLAEAAHARCPGQKRQGCHWPVAMVLGVGVNQGEALVRGGDRIDIVASYRIRTGTVAQTLVRDALVLQRQPAGQGAGAGAPGAAPHLVVELSRSQSLRVALAEALGHIAVVLRPAGTNPRGGRVRPVLTPAGLSGGAVESGLPASPGALP